MKTLPSLKVLSGLSSHTFSVCDHLRGNVSSCVSLQRFTETVVPPERRPEPQLGCCDGDGLICH